MKDSSLHLVTVGTAAGAICGDAILKFGQCGSLRGGPQ